MFSELATWLLTLFTMIISFLGLATTEWYVGSGKYLGIASGCHDGVESVAPEVAPLLHFTTPRYCNLAYSHLQNGYEVAMFWILLFSGLLAFATSLSLCFCCTSKTIDAWVAGLLFIVFGLQTSTLFLFPASHGWAVPEGMTLGWTYYVMILGSIMTAIASGVSLNTYLAKRARRSVKAKIFRNARESFRAPVILTNLSPLSEKEMKYNDTKRKYERQVDVEST
eukprot:comp22096_c0_seq1/m.32231 comp22096_c0_seq1/g.32231  ORF comp22096_c0_seq1/g.32231 comp22096_c0_seq1/m.32231 type:complete len:224 (-) comp22096_c0_seq1:742-1413(-)